MAFGDADLAYMIGEDFGVAVTIGATVSVGIIDRNTVDTLEGQVVPQLGQDISVLVKRGVFTVSVGTSAVVDGVTYTVRNIGDEDQSLTRLFLRTGT
jgi:hypothetical protein